MKLISLIILTLVSLNAFAEKKDFKGLFGSYRREKFTENEGASSAFGVDLMLSTLVPISSIVKSSEDGSTFNDMYYSTFFNYELGFFLSLNYNWEIFANFGYYTYDTRKVNSATATSASPQFQQFDEDMVPMVLGIKYRMSKEDIVPYFGAGVGYAYVHRKGYYDYNPTLYSDQYNNALVAEALAGVEFYFAPHAGLRLEVSFHYVNVPSFLYNTGGTPGIFPQIAYQGNPMSIRYASGIFVLF